MLLWAAAKGTDMEAEHSDIDILNQKQIKLEYTTQTCPNVFIHLNKTAVIFMDLTTVLQSHMYNESKQYSIYNALPSPQQ